MHSRSGDTTSASRSTPRPGSTWWWPTRGPSRDSCWPASRSCWPRSAAARTGPARRGRAGTTRPDTCGGCWPTSGVAKTAALT